MRSKRPLVGPLSSSARLILLIAFACCSFGQLVAQDLHLQPIPYLSGPVVDTTNTLTDQEAKAIELRLLALEQTVGSQVVVVIVPTTLPESIEQYSIRLAEAWKVGRDGVDDGVVLLVSKGDRKLRIEVGYGLEGAIPDARAKQIIDGYIVPHFREGNFYDGIAAGVDAIISLIKQEDLPPPPTTEQDNTMWLVVGIFGAIDGLFSLIGIVLAFRASIIRGVVCILVVVVPALIGFALYSFSIVGPLLLLVIGIIAYTLIGILLLQQGLRGMGQGGSSGSSFFRVSSSSSSSFSGGGGSFGGGGASGSW